MFKVTLKSLFSHKARLIFSLLAIILGVAFVAGSFTFTDMMRRSFENIASGTVSDVSVTLDMKTDDLMAYYYVDPTDSPRLKEADLEKIRQVDGVTKAAGTIVGSIYTIDKDGKVITTFGPPTVSSNYYDLPAWKNQPGITVLDGRAPAADNEAGVDPETLRRSGLKLGDQIRFTDGAHTWTKTLVGTLKWGTGGTSGALYNFFNDKTARELMMPGVGDGYMGAWISLEDYNQVDQVVKDLKPLLPQDFKISTGDEDSKEIMKITDESLGFMTIFFLVFAAIALLVGSILIINTFSIIVTQQSRELALYRILGAYQRQVRLLIVGEALFLGLIGSVIGLFAGMGISSLIVWILNQTVMDLGSIVPRPTVEAIVASFAVGLGVTTLSSLMPSIRASRVDPIVALSGHESTTRKSLQIRLIVATILVVLGAVFLGLTFAGVDPVELWLGSGAVALLIGLSLGSPLFGSPLVNGIGWIFTKLHGTPGRLARLNALRHPQRTAATATALIIGMALVTTLGIFGASAKASTIPAMEETFGADMMVLANTNPYSAPVSVPEETVEKISNLAGVESVSVLREGSFLMNKKIIGAYAFDPGEFNTVLKTVMVQGRTYKSENEAVISEKFATEKKLRVGSTMHLTDMLGTSPQDLEVVGIYQPKSEMITFGDVFVPADWLNGVAPSKPAVLLVNAESPDKVDAVVDKINEVTKDSPLIGVQTVDDILKQVSSSVDMLLAQMFALLALAVIIATLGIVNTLSLSILERVGEIGMLRVVGMLRRDVRRMIRDESVIISLLGSILGIILGVVLGVAASSIMRSSGLEELAIPWASLGITLVLAVLIGVFAGLWPARAASRVDVLDAIAQE